VLNEHNTVFARSGPLYATFGGWTACTQRTAQGKDFELILTVKWNKTSRRETIWP